jgi:hypothetical protein
MILISFDVLCLIHRLMNCFSDKKFIMANTKLKPQEKDELVIEEEIGVFQHTIEQISPSRNEKRKRDDEIPSESPHKYTDISGRNRLAKKTIKQASLSVPFWKQLNGNKPSIQLQTNEIGYFSLLNQTDEKECFDDKRYMRSKYSFHLKRSFLSFIF